MVTFFWYKSVAIKSLLEEQNNQCAICGIVFTEKGRAMPVVDHYHKTNLIRGVLCVKCNTGIGQLRDSASIVAKALKYLEGNQGIKPDFQTEVYTLLRFYFMGSTKLHKVRRKKNDLLLVKWIDVHFMLTRDACLARLTSWSLILSRMDNWL